MKFPFVILPRLVYDRMVEQLHDERERTRKLMRTIVKMKVAGGTIPRVLNGMRLEPTPPDPFQQAIEENKHSSRPAIKAALEAYVDREKKKGTRPEKILEVLRTWSTVRRSDDEDDANDSTDGDTIALVTDDDDRRPVSRIG